MNVADSKEALESRLGSYIWDSNVERNRHLHDILANWSGAFKRLAIVGGMPRDFALGSHDTFNSDIDIVIDAPSDIVATLANDLKARGNSFGGFSFRHADWKIDFWALETTWAARAGHVEVSRLEDVARCTFFDCDAILYDLNSRNVVCADGYLEGLRNGAIEINLAPTPAIHGNLYRAVRRIVEWEFTAGARLAAFIDKHLDERGFQSILRQDAALNPNPFTHNFRDMTALRKRALRNAR